MKLLKKVFFATLLMLATTQFTNAQRQYMLLDGEWKFCIDSTKTGLKSNWHKTGLPNQQAQIVNVPHTWNVKKETARYWGWAWYQREITVPANWQGKNIEIQFDAVYHDATVWVNGKLVGEHKNSGFNRFSLNINNNVKIGATNTITVLADNSFSRTNIPFLNSFDWANDGGIIRSVNLIATGKLHINYVHVNTIANFSDVNKTTGEILVKVNVIDVENAPKLNPSFSLSIDEENQATAKNIFKGNAQFNLVNGFYEFPFKFDSVNAWHFDNPNLYKISVTALSNGTVSDNVSVNIGFRKLVANGYKFIFNGETVRLAGIESVPGSDLEQGMAESKAKLESNYLKKLEFLNTNWTRFHWQQDEYVLDWCDRNGIMVQEEIPIWGIRTLLNDTMLNTAKQHLTEMITNHYNHPCIIAWGVGNEVAGRKDFNIKGVKELYNYAKSLDSSRLVNYVSHTIQQARWYSPKGILPDASAEGDVLMFNDYHSTWYRQAQAGMANNIDTIRVENRPMPLVISEFGLCEPENYGGDSRRIQEMIYTYAVYESKFNVAGVFYFCVNDYRTHMGGGLYNFHNTREHGVFDINFNPKPSAFILRELNCPIEISGLNRNKENLIDIALVASNGFPSFTLKGYKLYWSQTAENYKNGELKLLPNINPGQGNGVKMQNNYNNKGVLTIENQRGKVVYQKVFEKIDPYF